jgi:glycosyltransferase involved in cell wall biosynthesis
MNSQLLARIFELPGVRTLAALSFMTRAYALRACGYYYRAISDLCWVVRVSQVEFLRRIARRTIDQLIDATRKTGRNPLIESYLRSSLSRKCAAKYSLAGPGSSDLFRDLIVLKSSNAGEKGVILLKYVRTFEAVIALFDFHRLLERYTFVLEPCWAGYCDPALLMYFAPGNPVIVESPFHDDYEFVRSIGEPFIPVSLGSADWVDASIFTQSTPVVHTYDLVMVGNWGAHKRHATLFRALNDIHDRDLRVLLVGFPWAGRTIADVRHEARSTVRKSVHVEFVDQVSQTVLARYLNQCKVFILLSRKEGHNKAIVEALFAGVPAIVFDQNIGGARNRINPRTGILSSDDELPGKIRYMLDHHSEFSPRSWAVEHTGSSIATRVLDATLSRVANATGSRYSHGIVEKVNSPNLAYRDQRSRLEFQADYDFIVSCARYKHNP